MLRHGNITTQRTNQWHHTCSFTECYCSTDLWVSCTLNRYMQFSTFNMCITIYLLKVYLLVVWRYVRDKKSSPAVQFQPQIAFPDPALKAGSGTTRARDVCYCMLTLRTWFFDTFSVALLRQVRSEKTLKGDPLCVKKLLLSLSLALTEVSCGLSSLTE